MNDRIEPPEFISRMERDLYWEWYEDFHERMRGRREEDESESDGDEE